MEEAMTVEVINKGGIRISGTTHELQLLAENIDVALSRGFCSASFLTEGGVAQFVIAAEEAVPVA
jgi:hypothetical protein